MSEIGRISGQLLKDNLLRDSNLNFKNTISDTALLHLDIFNRRIGVNSENPSDALEINTEFRTTNLRVPYVNIDNISIQNILSGESIIGNEIVSNIGDLIFKSADTVSASRIKTDDIEINNQSISTHTTNTNLELRPDGIGTLEIRSNWNITGNLHSTGDIIFGNNFTLGDNDNDSVDFNSDVASNIIPDVNSVYNLGSPTKKWANLYSNFLNGQRVEINDLTVGDTSLARRQGNIFYVAVNGSDSNVGDHQQGPFRTIKHALAVSDASSLGPVTIHVFPGVYEEEFPLTVPERVSIHGEDIRNTIVVPTVSTQNKDAFLLNQNCNVENITIKNFYYDNVNNTGYAFRFAPNALIVDRSPYVRNVTVITQGSVTSESDPRGFASGDAGKGAYIDGSVINSNSAQASMLFHSATFITPGVDCITMINGVRVEWLNSFTYFANIGLYALRGTGRIFNDGSTLQYGAEIRSIGSANVYGNYGAIADGQNTLMYLISHNFAYIGAGKEASNDRTFTLMDQEAVEINQGKIYYTSTDADGMFRIGNAFYVDFEKGTTSIDIETIDFSGVSSIFINTGSEVTYIDGERIDIGNIRFSGNTIYSLTGDIIWNSATDFVYFDNNVGFVIPKGSIAQRKNEESDFRYNTETNLFEGFTSANVTFGGIYSDNRQTSVISRDLQKDIVFTTNNIEVARLSGNNINLNDSSIGQFGNFEINRFNNDNILIENNRLGTILSNSNLELRPNGSSYTKIENLYYYDNIIENFENTNLSIFNTGQGYLKFDTSLGFVVPSGNIEQRPETPETGTTRWNYETDYLEIWNGTEWQRAAGEGEIVTAEIMSDLVELYTLVLG